jgi:hypothetical protein
VRIIVDYRPVLRQRSGVGEYIFHLIGALAHGPGRVDDIVLFSSSLRDEVDRSDTHGLAVASRRLPVRLLNRLWHRFEWPPIERLVRGPFDIAHSPHPLLLPTRTAARVVTIHDLDFLQNPDRTRDASTRHTRPARCTSGSKSRGR